MVKASFHFFKSKSKRYQYRVHLHDELGDSLAKYSQELNLSCAEIIAQIVENHFNIQHTKAAQSSPIPPPEPLYTKLIPQKSHSKSQSITNIQAETVQKCGKNATRKNAFKF
jgi:hypothetical protein